MIEIILLLLILWIIYNNIFYIPNKLKKQEEMISLHFKEVHIRMNRIEKVLDDKSNDD